ncbi:MAG: C69 family dipeptidase [bacterium]
MRWNQWRHEPGRLTLLLVFLLALPLAAWGQGHDITKSAGPGLESCTSIMVGRLASTDGSVMTAHSCDGNYRTWLRMEPAADHREGTMKQIHWGTLHTESPWDTGELILKGEIPEAAHTYAYMNVAYPCMNEHQLAIGETTIGGRRELRNDEGLFLIEDLQRIALERTTTAREAIRLIGELVAEYGYGDWGECLTFADPKEVWHFEIFGAGPFEKGAVWAAVRIPDGHVGVSANIPRISTLDLDDPDRYMASENVYSVAEEMGWYDPSDGEPFRMWEAYSGRRPFSDREFFVLSTMAPSLDLEWEVEELPFSVEPDEKVSVEDVFAYYRSTYEGHEFDPMKNLKVEQRRRGQEAGEMVTTTAVSPWMGRDTRQLLNTLAPGSVESHRTIAVARCSYSQVNQCRDWLPDGIGGIAWFSFDNPAQSPRIPIFAGVLELPDSFEVCAQERYRTDSAAWWFRRTNRLAMIKYGTTRQTMEEAVMAFQDRALTELPMVEQTALELYRNAQDGEDAPDAYRQYLTRYTNDFARATMAHWWELGDKFWALFARGF